MIANLFYLDFLRSNSFKQKFRQQVAEVVEAEALRVKTEAIQKLQLSHPWL